MPDHQSIESRFMADDSARTAILDYKRLCAHLTLRSILPPQEWTTKRDNDGEVLPSCFTARGRLGMRSFVGQLLLDMFPPGLAFWVTRVKGEYMNPANEAAIVQANSINLRRDLQALCYLENAGHAASMPIGFRTRMRQAAESLAVLGDTLIRGNKDYTQTVFRLDNYVVSRDDAGQPYYFVTREKVDVSKLGDNEDDQAERFEKSGIGKELLKKSPKEREKTLYTLVEFQPYARVWSTRQELNGKTIYEAPDREVCNYVSAAVQLEPGDNYGHGPAEDWEPDLFSEDRLRKRMLEWAAMCTRLIPVIDRGSNIRPQQLAQTPNGQPVFGGRVDGGVVSDVGFIKVDKIQDFTVVKDVAAQIGSDLDRSMLTGQGMVRQSERTTAFEVSEVSLKEKEASVGSFFSDCADTLQPQIVRWLFDEAARNGDIPRLPRSAEAVNEVVVMTGARAMAERAKAGKLAQIPILANQIGEQAVSRVKGDRIIADIIELQGIPAGNYLKSQEELEAEKQNALQIAAQQQAIASTGAVAESFGAEAAKAQFAPQ